MKLSEEQLVRIAKAASLGHALFDCVILAKVPSADAAEVCKDHQVIDAFQQGRTDGAERVREKLMSAAMAGNVSAMKALALHEAQDEDDAPPTDIRTAAEKYAERMRVEKSISELFDRQKALFEAVHGKHA